MTAVETEIRPYRSISCTESGWTDTNEAITWLKEVFHPFSAAKNTSGRKRLLILDGHVSHVSLEFLETADGLDIIVLCLPPHTTHELQPADKGAFPPLALYWKQEVNAFMVQNGGRARITKAMFPAMYHSARVKAFTRKTIKSAFRATGIYPLDPSAIPDEAFAPAENTTTKSSLPLPATRPLFLIDAPNASEASISPSPLSRQSIAPSLPRHKRANSLPSLSDVPPVPHTSLLPSFQFAYYNIPEKENAGRKRSRENTRPSTNENLNGSGKRARIALETIPSLSPPDPSYLPPLADISTAGWTINRPTPQQPPITLPPIDHLAFDDPALASTSNHPLSLPRLLNRLEYSSPWHPPVADGDFYTN